MNREKAVRYAYGAALVGITYDASIPVSVYDEKLEDSADAYILLTSQDANYTGNFHNQSWTTRQTVEIILKQQNSVSKDWIDDISEQIENIVITSSSNNGLPAQTGWQFRDVFLESVSYSLVQESGTRSILTKTLIFNQTVIKT